MRYVDYDPKQHKGMKVYAIEDGAPTEDGALPMVLREVTDPDEREAADSVPWFYVVQVAEPAGAPEPL